MSDNEQCGKCGAELQADTAGGLCPRCLLALSFASQTMPEGEAVELTVSLSPEEMREHFPQYEILECLGRGGMGVVYKARQKALDRLVAIKVLAGERQGDIDFARRFEREAKILAQMNHPNIVTVYDFGESEGLYYIVMEYVDGVNLRDVLRDEKMDPEQALAIVPPVCEALEYAHDKGVVHRDIKPENLLLDREGRVKIADFGIASLVGVEGENSGTPPYMAPEQEKGVVDQRADIYALGAVLYEMLTGERPGTPVEAPSRKILIDVRLDEIVLRALDREPERRYQTAGEFRTMVETVAVPPQAGSGGQRSEVGGRKVGGAVYPDQAKPSRLRGILATAALHAVLLLVFLIFAAYGVPRMLAPLQDMAVALPGVTILAINAARLLQRFWWLIFPPLLALDLGVSYVLYRFGGRRAGNIWSIAVALTVVLTVLAAVAALALPYRQRLVYAALSPGGAPMAGQTVASFEWSELAAQGRVPGAEPVVVDGRNALKIVNHDNVPLQLSILSIDQPPVTALRYALTGEIRYENVEGEGYLELWNTFPPARSGGSEVRFFTRTLAPAGSGPMGKIVGTSDWRPFSLPFDRTGTGHPPTRLEFNVFLPAHGVVYFGTLRLMQSPDPGRDHSAVPSGMLEGVTLPPPGGVVDNEMSSSESTHRFPEQKILALPVRPPLAVPTRLTLPIPDSERLTTEQVKKSLDGVRWGPFLKALAADGNDDSVAVREVSSGDGGQRRFEVAFHWLHRKDNQMLLDLMVDPAFSRAEPARLRNAANPDRVVYASAAAIMPELAAAYMKKTDPVLKAEIAARDRHPEDVKTLEHYSSALHIYRRSKANSLPPTIKPLIGLVEDYFGKKKPDGSHETVGFIKNDATGTMDRPIYHGSADIRLEDLEDHPNFIMFAAPSPDVEGRRLVVFGRGIYTRAIKEEDYQKQIAKQDTVTSRSGTTGHSQATGILKRTVKALSPYELELDGKTDSLYLRGEVLEKIPDGTRIRVEGTLRTELYDNSNASTPAVMPRQWHVYMDVKECRAIKNRFDSATTAPTATHVAIAVTPDALLFNGRAVSLEMLESELKKLPPDTVIKIAADSTLKHARLMAVLDVCQKAGMTHLSVGVRNPARDVFACRLINGKYTMEHPLNAGSGVLLSDRHVAHATLYGEGDKATLAILLNDMGQQELHRLAKEISKEQHLAVYLGGESVPAEAVSQDPKTGTFVIKLNSLSESQVEQAKTFAKPISDKSVEAVNTFAKGKWSPMTADQVRESPAARGGNISLPFDEPVYLHFRAVEKHGKDKPEAITLDYWVSKPASSYDIIVLVEDLDSKYREENEVIKKVSVSYTRIDREQIDRPGITEWKMNDTGGGMGRTFKMAGDSISWREGWRGGNERVTTGKPVILYELYDRNTPKDNFRRMMVEFASKLPENRQQLAFHQVIQEFLAACREAEVDSPEAMEKQLGLDVLRQREAEGEDMEKADRGQWHPVLRALIEHPHGQDPYEDIKKTYVDQPSLHRKEAILLLKVMGYKCPETMNE